MNIAECDVIQLEIVTVCFALLTILTDNPSTLRMFSPLSKILNYRNSTVNKLVVVNSHDIWWNKTATRFEIITLSVCGQYIVLRRLK